MSEVKISEILHTAADEYLSTMEPNCESEISGKLEFSCHAIEYAIADNDRIHLVNKRNFFETIKTGLVEMGLEMYGVPKCWVRNLDSQEKKRCQQERYSWLKFAALIAEEQGV